MRKNPEVDRAPEHRFDYLVTSPTLAMILGVSQMTISNYVGAGMPKLNRSRFDLREAVPWAIKKKDQRQTDRGGTSSTIALRRAQREKIKLEIAKLRATLVPRVLMDGTIGAVAALISSQLESLGPRLAPGLVDISSPEEIQAKIFAEARAVRSAIAEEVKNYAAQIAEQEATEDDDEDEEDDDIDEGVDD